jgi:riboflavin synthase
MFTGIIEGQGRIAGMKSGSGIQLTIEAFFALDGTKIGDSIAINGACLTAVQIEEKCFKVDVSPETVAKTTFNDIKTGEIINIEKALKISDRIDGHLVSGHIDGTGILKSKKQIGNAIIIRFEISEDLSNYMIQKGSVAVDGISLTINECGKDFFEVSIIPHTAQITTIGQKKSGDRVNIETDMLGKYVEKFIGIYGKNADKKQESSINMEFLTKTGFL